MYIPYASGYARCSLHHFNPPVKNKPMTKKELIKQVEDLEKQVKELREGAESMQVDKRCVWEPEDEEVYFRANTTLDDVTECINVSQTYTNNHLSYGNCFETREEAEQFREWLKARAVLIKDMKIANGDWKPGYNDDDEYKFTVYYDYDDYECCVEAERFTRSSEIVFKSRSLAEQSIQEHETEWRIYLNTTDHD